MGRPLACRTPIPPPLPPLLATFPTRAVRFSVMRHRLILALLAILIAAPLLFADGPTTAPARLTIAVIPKGTTHSYWNSIHAGAQRAADDLGVDIIWKGPLLEDDRAQQIAIVEQFIGQGVSGIVVAPLDNVALKRPVDSAMSRNIPVVIVDSALKGEVGKDYISFIATDNKAGGRSDGEELARLLHGKGNVVMLRYEEGSASTLEREAGFLEAMAAHPDMKVLVSNRYAGATMADAKDAALQMMDQIKSADGVFASNESTAFGMLLALRQAGVAGKIKFVGFDTSQPLIDGLKSGEINALVAQNPKKMGYDGVATIVHFIRHDAPIEQHIDSGAVLITSDNLNSPDVQKLLAAP